MLIPTYNESREILIPSIAAAVGLQPAHETWVLDDGNRAEIRELAEVLGARYLARSEHDHAKAGNINHALRTVQTEFVAILDADHVATPGFLQRTLGYFEDPHIALVQTPQDFYNIHSFEHSDSEEARGAFHEQQLFYRVIQPGKNRWGGAFWCGTGAVVRVAALRDVGGVATETITEDIHTTIRLHRRGWKTVYHNEVLARGLAADTAQQYQLQRLRWGTGAMQVLRKENPLVVSGLSLPQRISYGATLFGWFEAWRTLAYILLPIAVLFTGSVPIRTQPLTFLAAFGITFGLQQMALRLLSRGYHRFVLSVVFDIIRMAPSVAATLTIVWPTKMRFQVTPKGRESETDRLRPRPPPLLLALGLTCGAAFVWFLLTLDGLTPVEYESRWFAYGAVFWLVFNLAFIGIAIRRVSSLKYAPQRRAAARFPIGLAAVLDGRHCLITEISLTGVQVSCQNRGEPHLVPVGRRELEIGLTDSVLSLGAETRWHHFEGDGHESIGLEFTPGQTKAQAQLALAILNEGLRPQEAEPTADSVRSAA